MPVKTTIQIRRDAASNWSSQVLAAGEFGLDTTNMRLKIGDGSTAWSSLGYLKAASATVLETARTINGVSFNGSANITVPADAITLTGTTLASNIVSSYLTGVGTITSGTWSSSFGTVSGANLTNLTAGNLTGTIPSGVLGNSSLYIGTTQIPLNRTSGTTPITGITYLGMNGSTSGTLTLYPSAVSGSSVITFPATTGTVALTSDLPTVSNGTLTLGVSGVGLSGSQTFSANQAGNATFTVTSNATSLNTGSAIVARDSSGNFSAGTITATFNGNSSTASKLSQARNINGVPFDGSQDITVSTVSQYPLHVSSPLAFDSGLTYYDGSVNKTISITVGSGGVQAYSTSLNAISNLSATGTGYLKNTAGTWSYVNETYLTTTAAASTYQPVGSYLTTGAAASTYQPVGSYLTTTAAASTYQPVGSYLTTTDASANYLTKSDATSSYQPKDSDLTAIAGLTGSGLLRSTNNTWTLDSTSYLPSSTTYVSTVNGASGAITGIATTSAPTISNLTLAAGTSSSGGAPLYLNSGTKLTSAVAGAVEYDGKAGYLTPSSSGRAVLPAAHFYGLTSSRSLTSNSNGAQSIFGVGLTLQSNTAYEIDGYIQFSYAPRTGSVSASVAFGGSSSSAGTLIAIDYAANSTALGYPSSWTTTSATGSGGSTVANAGNAQYVTVRVKGLIRVGTGGSWNPTVTFGGSSVYDTASVTSGSYVKMTPIGLDTVNSIGGWA
jgi:hypothetical protein